MEKKEFEERIERSVPDADYKIIEMVYQFHPSIRETSGQEEVAELYKSFGMAIFYDMLPRAEKNSELEKQLLHAKAEVERIRDEMEELSLGNALERVRVLPEALEEHMKMQNRQRENDRQRLSMAREGLGISV